MSRRQYAGALALRELIGEFTDCERPATAVKQQERPPRSLLSDSERDLPDPGEIDCVFARVLFHRLLIPS
jgi:hypothetical protein